MTAGKTVKRNGKPNPVHKEFLLGNWVSALAAKRGIRVFTYQLVFIFVYLFLGQMLVFDSAWLRWLLNIAFVASFAALLYSDGAKVGADDVTFAEIAMQRKQTGKQPDRVDLDRCYHPWKGLFTTAVGVLPFFLLALVFAFITQPQVYSLGALPSWLTAFESRADVGQALQYYHEAPGFGLQEILRIIVRLSIFPFVNMVGTESQSNLHLLERLSPLLILVIPAGYPLGYLHGRRLRANIHGAIRENSRKRAVRERKERKNRVKNENRLV